MSSALSVKIAKHISVIVGNPPYRANQKNENDNNKNRGYQKIDHQIRQTYVANSKAQKTKAYDPFVRFFRWASNRLKEDGIIAFITNRAFIDKDWADGFRKVVAEEFSEIYLVDLGADIRANPKLSGTRHNVFGIQTGVAISFMVKRTVNRTSRIFYVRRPEMETAEEKLRFLANNPTRSLSFKEVQPDPLHNWINLTSNDFDSLIPLANKETKAARTTAKERAIFKLYSLGESTNRDEWITDFNSDALASKMKFFIQHYNKRLGLKNIDSVIKWSETLHRRCKTQVEEPFELERIALTLYRPYVQMSGYHSNVYVDRPGLGEILFPPQHKNKAIRFMTGDRQEFCSIAAGQLPNLNMFSADAAQYCALNLYDHAGKTHDNVTDWALKQFTGHYESETGQCKDSPKITKEAIFYYCYSVLHEPLYREKYALNLKREFPRIPFYANFWQWAAWGEALMKLHIGYESVESFSLECMDALNIKARAAGLSPKALLRVNKDAGHHPSGLRDHST